jgi:hypothetical protein
MKTTMERRESLTASLVGLGGIVFASDLVGGRPSQAASRRDEDFFFVQLSDTHWGFKNPEINPGKVTQVKFTPDKLGEFPFHCDVFCGSGHDQMEGTIKVTE